jgi:hypothetical protein
MLRESFGFPRVSRFHCFEEFDVLADDVWKRR